MIYDALKKYRVLITAAAISVFFLLLGFFPLWYALRGASTSLIVHFSGYTGIDRTGGFEEIIGLTLFGFFMVIVNFVVAFEFERHDTYLGKIVAWGTAALSCLLFLGLRAILHVNS